MKIVLAFVAVFLGIVSLVACSSTIQEPEPNESVRFTRATVTSDTQQTGFVLEAAASEFALGMVLRQESTGPFHRLIGTQGTIATGPNGLTLSVLNADAPAGQRPPLTRDPSTHNARVRKYFIDAGLPINQIGETTITTVMQGSGSINEPVRANELVAYNTILGRIINGISVPGSYAWARFNVDDEVTAEEVYWPMIPNAAVEAAVELGAELNDPASYNMIRSRLPTALQEHALRIVIWHPYWDTRDFRVVPAYAITGEGTEPDQYFDTNGKELK